MTHVRKCIRFGRRKVVRKVARVRKVKARVRKVKTRVRLKNNGWPMDMRIDREYT